MADKTLDFQLLPWQKKVWNDEARFKIIAAGRRTGKSRYAAYKLIEQALKHENCDVFYVAPTQGQARDIMWQLMLDLTQEIRTKAHVNNLQIVLINGSRISLKGSDRPDTMRGVSLQFVVLDEYADMKPDVWELVLRPALSDRQGGAVFIGTPQGRNHFYDIYLQALEGGDPSSKAWHFTTHDNPFIPKEEIELAKRTMSSFGFRQEFMASFEAIGSEIFKEEWVKFGDEPQSGDYYIAADLAGFRQQGERKTKKRLDNSAIAIVKVNEDGWWVKKVLVGRWTVEETAKAIFDAVMTYNPVAVGIERGISKQAIMSPLQDMQRRYGKFFNVIDCTHGNQNKTARITWALQGRFENGYITLNKGEWNYQFLDELFQFPDQLTHDDMIDALSYIDQICDVAYGVFDAYEEEEWTPQDEIAGY